jgi:hypothetical protein
MSYRHLDQMFNPLPDFCVPIFPNRRHESALLANLRIFSRPAIQAFQHAEGLPAKTTDRLITPYHAALTARTGH